MLFLSILQLPLLLVNLQMFLCNENPDLPFILDIDCASSTYQAFLAASVVFIIFAILFTLIQRQFLMSTNFDSKMPWASLKANKLDIIKTLVKFGLALSFIADKAGDWSRFSKVGAGIAFGIIVLSRMIDPKALIINEYVFYATIFYDGFLMFLFIVIGAHEFQHANDESYDTIFNLTLIGISAVIISCTLLVVRIQIKEIGVIKDLSYKGSSLRDLYFFRIYQMIKSVSQTNRITLKGIFYCHLEDCEVKTCEC